MLRRALLATALGIALTSPTLGLAQTAAQETPVVIGASYALPSTVYGGVREIHLLQFWGRDVLLAPMRHHEDQVDPRPQALYVLLHDVLEEWRRAGGRLGSPGPAVGGDVQV